MLQTANTSLALRQGAHIRAPCKARLRSVQVFAAAGDNRAPGLMAASKLCGIAAASLLLLGGGPAEARWEGVNKPELLPKEFTTVIDVAGFLTPGEESRIASRTEALERDTGIKLRVLAQNYPQTPGLAIKDYWGVDENTVVFVADPNTGNLLNFNVGDAVDLRVPRNFWSRLAGRYGTKFYWQDNGTDVAIVNTVAAIDNCLREPIGRGQCSDIRGELE